MQHLLQLSETPVEVQVFPLIIYPHFLMEILANDTIAADLMQLSDNRLPASSSLQRLPHGYELATILSKAAETCILRFEG
jgi:hypothetical protein